MRTRTTAILLSLIFLMGFLSGCRNQETPHTQPVPETQATTSPIPTLEELVIPAISKTYEWEDGVGNQNRVTIRLPQMNLSANCAARFNTSIDSFANDIISEVEACAEGAFSTHIVSVDYEAYRKDDALSILIITNTSTDYVEYEVWNFDLANDDVLSTADLCRKYLDMEYPVFLKYTYDQIWNAFEQDFANFVSQYPQEIEFLRQYYLDDLSALRNYSLYFGENGRLMLLADHPSLAGAAYYAHLEEFQLDPARIPAASDAWNWLFDLYLTINDMNAENLLYTAYEHDPDAFAQHLSGRSAAEQEILKGAINIVTNSKG